MPSHEPDANRPAAAWLDFSAYDFARARPFGFPHRVPPFLRDVSHKILYRPRAYLVVSKTGKNTSMLALASYAARVEMRPTLDVSPASHRRVWAGDIKCEAIR